MTKIRKAKTWYVRNERKILYSTLTVTALMIVSYRAGLKQHNQFLREHDLYEEFYAQVDE